jgi:hypothetical protein
LAPPDPFFIDILFGAVGCLLIAFRKRLARTTVDQQNRFYGLHRGERYVKFHEYVITFIGLSFVALSVLSLLGVGGTTR